MFALALSASFGFAANMTVTGSQDGFAQCRELGAALTLCRYDPIWQAFDQARFEKEYFGVIRAGAWLIPYALISSHSATWALDRTTG